MGVFRKNFYWGIVVFLILLPKPAWSAIILEEGSPGHFLLTPSIQIVPDPDRSLSLKDVIRFKGKETPSKKEVFIGTDPAWILLEIDNRTQKTTWFLNFGGSLSGRMGFIQSLKIYTLPFNGPTQSHHVQMPLGSFIPLLLPARTHMRMAIFIDTASRGSFPLTLTPYLMDVSHVVSPFVFPTTWPPLIEFCLLSFGLLFIVLAITKQQKDWIFFGLYYIFYAALLLITEIAFYMPFASWFLFCFLALSSICALLGNALFFESQPLRTNIPLMTICSFVGGGAILGSVAPSLLATFLFSAISIGIFLYISLVAILHWIKGHIGAAFYAMTWTIPIIGHSLTLLQATGLISLPWSILALNSMWLGLFIQFCFLMEVTRRRTYRNKIHKNHLKIQKIKKMKALEKFYQEKKFTEQTDLMHDLEHERALMTELRAREQERSEEMYRAKEAADEANRAKSAFLAMVSHEIRTPMTGILGTLRLLEHSGLSREQKAHVTMMRTSSDSMMLLLNDILDLEKIGSGQMILECVDFHLSRLIESIATLMSAHAHEKGLSLTVSVDPNIPPYIIGDPNRLRQVLLNLLNNAIKFTKEGGVTLRIKEDSIAPSTTQSTLCTISFEIEDTGIGISPDVAARLFIPFSQADSSTTRKYGGTGLGLAICKQIVGAMGGNIQIKSAQNKGTIFFFTLTMPQGKGDTPEDTTENEDDADRPPVPSMTILIVEDNSINGKILSSMLEAHNHKVTWVQSGEEAIETVKEKAFDVIFMDINLNDMNGLETTKILRRTNKTTPIIALTGHAESEYQQKCYAIQMNGLLLKPISPTKLYDTLEKIHAGHLDNPLRPFSLSMEDEDEDEDAIEFMASIPPIKEKKTNAIQSDFSQDVHMDIEQDFVTPVSNQQIQPSSPALPPSTLAFEDDMNNSPTLPPSTLAVEDTTSNTILNTVMLHSLSNSVGQSDFLTLMEGFWEKTEDLKNDLETALVAQDMLKIGARGHELKGMAGNFGILNLSVVAGIIERTAKMNQMEEAKKAIESIPAIIEEARTAFDQWTKEGVK